MNGSQLPVSTVAKPKNQTKEEVYKITTKKDVVNQ
jgi:hypothetical protein